MDYSQDLEFDIREDIIVGSKPYKVQISYTEQVPKDNKSNQEEMVEVYRTVTKYAYTEEDAMKTLKSELEKVSNKKNIVSVEEPTVEKITDLKIDLPYTMIGRNAFANRELTSVEFNDIVSIISDSAFANNNLSKIVLPKALGVIGENAFANNKLTEVFIPERVASIDAGAFKNNELTKVTFDSDSQLTYFGEEAFANNKLTSVTIPAGVTRIKPRAFDEMTDVQKADVQEAESGHHHKVSW